MAAKKKHVLRNTLITLGALAAVFFIARAMGWVGKKDILKVTVAAAELRTIIETVTANGKVQPEVELKISADVSGEITELYVEEGDSVTAGTLLLRINPDLYLSNVDRLEAAADNARANLANAQARLLQTEARFKEAESNYKRNVKLHSQKLISDAEFESANANFTSAKAEVEATRQTIRAAEFSIKSALASVQEARKSLNRTSIYAPVSGIISRLNKEKGERVVGTAQMEGTEILRIANLYNMEVSVEVNENDIIRVSKGDTALIEVDAYENRKFKGIVTEIANSANTLGASADQVTNFTVKVRMLRSSYEDLIEKSRGKSPFRPGMSATIDIQTEIRSNVLTVPIEAVTTRGTREQEEDKEKKKKNEAAGQGEDEQPKTQNEPERKSEDEKEVVFRYENGIAVQTEVKTGIQDDTYIQILQGLKEKEEVITGPYEAVSKTLKDKAQVLKVKKEDLFEFKKIQ